MVDHYFGGVDTDNETITFFSDHHIASGVPLVYDRNGNDPLGVSTVGNDSVSVVGLGTTTLVDKSTYYPEVINSKTIKLYQKLVEGLFITKDTQGGLEGYILERCWMLLFTDKDMIQKMIKY